MNQGRIVYSLECMLCHIIAAGSFPYSDDEEMDRVVAWTGKHSHRVDPYADHTFGADLRRAAFLGGPIISPLVGTVSAI